MIFLLLTISAALRSAAEIKKWRIGWAHVWLRNLLNRRYRFNLTPYHFASNGHWLIAGAGLLHFGIANAAALAGWNPFAWGLFAAGVWMWHGIVHDIFYHGIWMQKESRDWKNVWIVEVWRALWRK